VNVTAETPIVDPERAGLSINISNEALTQVPISTQRRYQDVWALAPGVFVRPDQADINPSVNSRGTSENSTKLDGMDVTDPFGGGVFSVSFNYDAGTQFNDANETTAVKAVFGEYAQGVNISSTKSCTGHTLGASGAIEAMICVKALQEGIIPPTINLTTPDPSCSGGSPRCSTTSGSPRPVHSPAAA
jgi:hypothetical protein